MGLANHARGGQGNISKAQRARTGDVNKQFATTKQPSVPSNIPGAGPQGVPPADTADLGAFARQGNVNLIPTVVAAQTGTATHGPAIVSSLARMGGQVKLAPGQFRAWAHPTDAAPPPASAQVALPAPAGPMIP